MVLKENYSYKNTNISFEYNTIDTDKKTIVCLHGFLESKAIFNFLYPDFKEYNLICIDLLGHGESGCIGFIHSMEDQADLVFELLNHLKLKKVNLLGHSMGGYIALAFLEFYSDYVDVIFLINSSSKADSETRKINRERGIELVKKNTNIFVQMAIMNLFTADAKKNNSDEIELLKNNALAMSTKGIIASMYGMKQRVDREYLTNIHENVIYLAGKNDELIRAEEIESEAKNSDSKYYIIKGGHMLWLENPKEIKKILKENL